MPADSNLKYVLLFCYKAPCLILQYPVDLKSKIFIISFGLNFTVSKELLFTSKVAEFLTNMSFSINALCTILCSILTMNNLEIPSIKGASIFINLFSLGFSITCAFGKSDIDLF